MSLCSAERRVFFLEEPVAMDPGGGRVGVTELSPSLRVAVPRLFPGESPAEAARLALLELCARYGVERPIAWYYTPMALEFAREQPASLVVYDCMDELSAFRGAPEALVGLERELFSRADLVFTGGESLFRSKRALHPRVHCFPSSVDMAHFAAARKALPPPPEQAAIRHPRLGFFGVIDERMDLPLLARLAETRPDWHIVLIGPVVKIDPSTLPRAENIHFLGPKPYSELPRYLAGWDVALMPFALNESTRFISPTKTLEYLAGGCRVVSTPIADVLTPYAERGLVRVGSGADAFIAAVQATFDEPESPEWRAAVDACLAGTSWERTWSKMSALMAQALESRQQLLESRSPESESMVAE